MVRSKAFSPTHGGTRTLKHFPHHWHILRVIHRLPVDSFHKEPVMRSFGVFFDINVHKPLKRHSSDPWIHTRWPSDDVILMQIMCTIGRSATHRFHSYPRVRHLTEITLNGTLVNRNMFLPGFCLVAYCLQVHPYGSIVTKSASSGRGKYSAAWFI